MRIQAWVTSALGLERPLKTLSSAGRASGARRQVRISSTVAHVWVREVLVVCLVGSLLCVGLVASPLGRGQRLAAAVRSARFQVIPSRNLTDGRMVTVVARGLVPGEAGLALECSLEALTKGEAACENRRNSVAFADARGDLVTTLEATEVIRTQLGRISCGKSGCVIALVNLAHTANPEKGVLVKAISFASLDCAVHETPSCKPPVVVGSPTASGGSESVMACPAAPLSSSTPITGPGKEFIPQVKGCPNGQGQGVLQLEMEAPGTSWGSSRHRSVVVSVSVGGGPPQSFVLFYGGRPFTYAGYLGPLAVGSHVVSWKVLSALSVDGRRAPVVRVIAAHLSVVEPSNPWYLPIRYAPFIYGRAISSRDDVQLLTAASTHYVPGGTRITYYVVWSKEFAGTSFVPWLEWGEWGRMTDIGTVYSVTVERNGEMRDPEYLSCGCKADFPSEVSSPEEVTVPFHGSYAYGTHPVLVNASGNDYMRPTNYDPFSSALSATSAPSQFGFAQVPVAGPAPGQLRESVMDRNPWTYRVMAEETRRFYDDISSDPRSPEPGSVHQMAIVSLDTTKARSVEVSIRLSGSRTWYSNTYGVAYPLFTGGHHRTAVKLPEGWYHQKIEAVKISVFPASLVKDFHVGSLRILGIDHAYHVVQVLTPSPEVVPGKLAPEPAITLSVPEPAVHSAVVIDHAEVTGLSVLVTDDAGALVAGIPVVFSVLRTRERKYPGRFETNSGEKASVVVTSNAEGAAVAPPWEETLPQGPWMVRASALGFQKTLSLSYLGVEAVCGSPPHPCGTGGLPLWELALIALAIAVVLVAALIITRKSLAANKPNTTSVSKRSDGDV